MIPNLTIRQVIRNELLRNYQVAGELGISTSLFYQRLQRDLSPEQEKEIYAAIDRLKRKREQELAEG